MAIGQRFLGALKCEKLQLLNLLSFSSCAREMVKCLPFRLAGREFSYLVPMKPHDCRKSTGFSLHGSL